MNTRRRALYFTSIGLSAFLLLGAWIYSQLALTHGKSWTTHGWPQLLLELSYLASFLAVCLAFAGRSWYRIAGILLGLFALFCWIQTGFYE